ncbi:hypothetical protein [uncultured Victivallis sp.]|uniref:hypothetical protein n=1 Tax=uncultured Victivallis sp. TaxID=354118 RepID=UPI0025EC6AD8|nr:hypothetical protein [uncultured Victivallis sp.]
MSRPTFRSNIIRSSIPVPIRFRPRKLQEEEFDEAVVPKTLHEDLPVFELFEPLRLIRFALRRSPCSTLPLFGGIRARAPSSTPAVLRC